MSSTTINPDATTSNTGTRTGGSNVHGVLSDSDDATYMTYVNGEGSTLSLSDPSIPAGAVIKGYSVVVRASTPLAGRLSTVLSLDGTIRGGQTQVVTNTAISQWASLYVADDDFDPTTASLTVSCTQGQVKVAKARIDVVYVAQPVVTISPIGS